MKQDSDSRLRDCDLVIDSLQKMQGPLKRLVEENATAPTAEIIGYLADAKLGMSNFLSKVPEEDRKKVDQWIKVVGSADNDHNGKLDKSELTALSKEDADLYKAVGDFIGN